MLSDMREVSPLMSNRGISQESPQPSKLEWLPYIADPDFPLNGAVKMVSNQANAH